MADIRVGKVSSVNVSARTARVIFGDRGDMVSGELAVLRNSPLITADITTDNKKWSVSETYSSAPRTLGRGEHYDKAEPDSISARFLRTVTRWTLIFTAGCLISVRWSSALFRTAARGAAISSGVFKWLLEVLEMLFSKSAMTGS